MYHYALNKMKLQRAIAEVGPAGDERAIRAAYVKLGGAVDPQYAEKEDVKAPEPIVPVSENTEMPVVELEPEAPKKAAKKVSPKKPKK